MPSLDSIPFGYCHCGCGQKTKIAIQDDPRSGSVKGQPFRYVAHHHKMKVGAPFPHYQPDPNIPYGYCQCGCGEKAPIATQTWRRLGVKAGEPFRYIKNHHTIPEGPEYIEEDRGYKTPCWIWQRTKTPRGYGCRYGGPAYRLMYEKKHGPVPDGLELDHLCRQPSCVNPDHLEPVTHAENMRRGINTRLTVADVLRLIEMRRGGADFDELGATFKIHPQHARRICVGKKWKGIVPFDQLPDCHG